MNGNRLYQFGPFVADAAARRLLHGGQVVAVTPKVFDTLLYLLQHRERILPREELLAAIWQGRRVEEANLTQTISMLRKALGESDGVKYVGTFPGKGYRFLVPVEEREVPVAPDPAAGSASATRRRRRGWIAAGVLAVTLAAGFYLVSRSFETPAPPTVRRLLTSLPGNEFQPALSADGRQLAFVWDGEQEPQPPAVYIRPIDEDAARPLSPGYSAQSSPAWSPDGRFVAYLRQDAERAALVVVPAKGGEDRTVTELHRTRYGLTFQHLDWSPDGKSLVFDDKEKEADPFSLFLVDVASGIRRRLTSPSPSIIGDVAPRFSPDGEHVAFVRMTYRFQHDLYLVDARGGEARELTNDRRQIGGLDWHRDGKSVLFSSDRAGGFTVFELPLTGGSPRALGIAGNHPLQISTARQSPRLAYAEFAQDLNIWRLRLPSGGKRAAWERVVASTAMDVMPQVSPDGRWLSFRSDRDGMEQIWVAALDGSSPRALTRGNERPFAGRWSPNSRELVFSGVGGGGALVVPVSGGIARRAPGPPLDHSHPFYASDGKLLAVGDGRLQRLDPTTGRLETRPMPGWHSPHGMTLGDGGRSVYFVEGRTGTAILRGSIETGASEKVMDGLLPGHWGSWSLCGGSITYLGSNPQDSGRPWVMRRALAGGKLEPLVPWTGPLPPIGTSLWSSDPRTCDLFAERIDRGNTDVVLLENLP